MIVSFQSPPDFNSQWPAPLGDLIGAENKILHVATPKKRLPLFFIVNDRAWVKQ
jgi:hypothetical protein